MSPRGPSSCYPSPFVLLLRLLVVARGIWLLEPRRAVVLTLLAFLRLILLELVEQLEQRRASYSLPEEGLWQLVLELRLKLWRGVSTDRISGVRRRALRL